MLVLDHQKLTDTQFLFSRSWWFQSTWQMRPHMFFENSERKDLTTLNSQFSELFVCVCVLPLPWESMHLHFLLFQVSEERKNIWSPFGHHSFHNKPSFPESYWVIPLFSFSRLNNSSPFNLFSEVLFVSLQLNHFHYSPLGSLQVFCIKICCFAIEMPRRVLFFHLNQDKRKAAPRPASK